MGFLDDIFKAVESGALEERLNKLADSVESASKRLDNSLEKAADKPDRALRAAENSKDTLEAKLQTIKTEVTKQADVIRKKD
jgi:hypothetical protein